MEYLPHQLRVVEEHEDLAIRYAKLCDFLRNPVFETIKPVDQYLLLKQVEVMDELLEILTARISVFS